MRAHWSLIASTFLLMRLSSANSITANNSKMADTWRILRPQVRPRHLRIPVWWMECLIWWRARPWTLSPKHSWWAGLARFSVGLCSCACHSPSRFSLRACYNLVLPQMILMSDGSRPFHGTCWTSLDCNLCSPLSLAARIVSWFWLLHCCFRILTNLCSCFGITTTTAWCQYAAARYWPI